MGPGPLAVLLAFTLRPSRGLSCPSRYGLPVNFQAVLLQPQKKSVTKRLREVLNSVFRHLDEVAAASILDVGIVGTRAHCHHTLARSHRLPSKGVGVWWWGRCTGQNVCVAGTRELP